ncbi:uncharacterized protein LOC133181549 [Saccostrea echinata]|uniref:uncharacterized protein LOC133181549 n=1 Tax=Saccostrea echinata TaxID=191078 RepID=UPI002A7F94EA|nr:uncharacterized protein LOC133181549 [Saccostrea echinata]
MASTEEERFKPPKFKRKRQMSSVHDSSSSSDTATNYRARPKKSHLHADRHVISKWTTKTLVEYGITYDNNPISIEEFSAKIQSRAREVCDKKMPDFLSILKMLCKRGLIFSLEVPEKETLKSLDIISDSMTKARKILNDFDAFINDILIKEEEYLGKEWRNKALFFAWSHNVRSFLNYYKKFLDKMNSSMTESWLAKPDREACLKELFMVFSKIFFLEPELGDKEVKRLIIGSHVVSCIPDIRFTWLNTIQRSVLMMLTEAKKDEPFPENRQFESRKTKTSGGNLSDSDQTFGNYIHRILSINVLGQHGGELLSELRSSAFAPTMVVGCICKGTEIIFTYMEMTQNHLNKIVYDGKCEGESSLIRYTKPLNYLMEEDRNKCLDLLFLLGFMQTSGYEDLYPNPEGRLKRSNA